ncbi:MAG: hypothetical protein CM15mP79_1530 [Methanobacteriota archaeon]|nr:MAG: hypothetical protein CM15mP79_1530 [Euryarchaeota archaeon]
MQAAPMQATMPAAAPKQKMVAFLLGFFPGVFGVHNFYLGKKGMGPPKLLVTVLTLGFGPASARALVHDPIQGRCTPRATPFGLNSKI